MDRILLREYKRLLKECNADLKRYSNLGNTKRYEQLYATANDLSQMIANLEYKIKHA